MKIIQQLAKLSGRVRVAVLEEGRVVRRYPWQNNLILDQGMDMVATTLINQCFTAACVGTGTVATNRYPPGTATISGTTLTVSATGTFSNADLDADVVMQATPTTTQRFKIVAVDSTGAILTTKQSGNITSPVSYWVEYTNQTQLASEVKRTAIALGTPGASGSTVTPQAITLQRTWQFSPETVSITYTELGFSNNAAAGPNLFSRILLTNPVTLSGPSANLPGGQQLQVTYQLIWNFDYGQGPGIFFPGTTPTNISFTNLPVNYSIFAYANSTANPGNLAVSVPGNLPVLAGSSITLSGSSTAAYNSNWQILASSPFTDPTHGASTLVTLSAPWLGNNATGGILTISSSAFFFRATQGIFLVGSVGQSQAPSPTPQPFDGYGEPSVGGAGWISTTGPSGMGSNNNPVLVDPNSIIIGGPVVAPYTPGSFQLLKILNFTIPAGGSQFNLLSFGYGLADNTNQIETYCWNQPQPCAPGSTIQIIFAFNWSRPN